jgi:hypothetical protein
VEVGTELAEKAVVIEVVVVVVVEIAEVAVEVG